MDYASLLTEWCGGPDSSHRLTRRVWWGPRTRFLYASRGTVILGVASEQQPDGVPALDPEGEKRLHGPLGSDVEDGWRPISVNRLAALFELDSGKTPTLEGLPYDGPTLFQLWTALSGPEGCTVEVVRLDPNDRTCGHALRATTEGRRAWIAALTESGPDLVELTAKEDSEESTEATEQPNPSSQSLTSDLEGLGSPAPGTGEVIEADAAIEKLVALGRKWSRRAELAAATVDKIKAAILKRLEAGDVSAVESPLWQDDLQYQAVNGTLTWEPADRVTEWELVIPRLKDE